MSADFYTFLHHFGLILTFVALGGLGALSLMGQPTAKPRPVFVALHGTGLVLVLVAGFGWLAKLGYGFPAWAIVKLLVWVGLGAIIVPLKRKPALAKPTVMVIVPALALVAVVVGVWHGPLFGS
jgi:hypothetical protein